MTAILMGNTSNDVDGNTDTDGTDPFEKASNALAEALHTNNIEQITKVTARLSDKDDYIRNRVFNMAKAKLRI